jgi:signal transduction histidine kinase
VRVAWLTVGSVFTVLSAAMTAVVFARGGGLGVLHVLLTPLVAWSFGVAGLFACLHRVWRRVGVLLLAVGFAWLVHLLDWTHVPMLVSVAAPLRNAYAAVFVHLLLAFPTGRLGFRWSRVLVVAGYLDVVVVQSVATALGGPGPATSWVRGDPSPAAVWYDVEGAVGILLACLALVTLVWRARSARGRPPATVWMAAVVAFVALLANLVSGWFAPELALVWWVVFSAAFAAVPFAFLASLLGLRLRRAGVAGLVVRLSRIADPAGLRDALADALRDPSLELAFWVPDRGGYVDGQGRRVVLPAENGGRIGTLVERDGRRIGALVHDVALGDEPELVEAVVAAAGLALDNSRLHAELRARLAELQASRVRLVETATAERRRIERNLHDGAQQRLVSVAFALGLARSRLPGDPSAAGTALAEAHTALARALEELRQLSQGIHPGVLVERGLRTAIAELAWAAPVAVHVAWEAPDRLSEAVELAGYYAVAEALTNTAKHARATSVRIEVSYQDGRAMIAVSDDGVGGADAERGTGLRGLADRAEVLGGRLTVHGSAGAGTTVRMELPCG